MNFFSIRSFAIETASRFSGSLHPGIKIQSLSGFLDLVKLFDVSFRDCLGHSRKFSIRRRTVTIRLKIVYRLSFEFLWDCRKLQATVQPVSLKVSTRTFATKFVSVRLFHHFPAGIAAFFAPIRRCGFFGIVQVLRS